MLYLACMSTYMCKLLFFNEINYSKEKSKEKYQRRLAFWKTRIKFSMIYINLF